MLSFICLVQSQVQTTCSDLKSSFKHSNCCSSPGAKLAAFECTLQTNLDYATIARDMYTNRDSMQILDTHAQTMYCKDYIFIMSGGARLLMGITPYWTDNFIDTLNSNNMEIAWMIDIYSGYNMFDRSMDILRIYTNRAVYEVSAVDNFKVYDAKARALTLTGVNDNRVASELLSNYLTFYSTDLVGYKYVETSVVGLIEDLFENTENFTHGHVYMIQAPDRSVQYVNGGFQPSPSESFAVPGSVVLQYTKNMEFNYYLGVIPQMMFVQDRFKLRTNFAWMFETAPANFTSSCDGLTVLEMVDTKSYDTNGKNRQMFTLGVYNHAGGVEDCCHVLKTHSEIDILTVESSGYCHFKSCSAPNRCEEKDFVPDGWSTTLTTYK